MSRYSRWTLRTHPVTSRTVGGPREKKDEKERMRRLGEGFRSAPGKRRKINVQTIRHFTKCLRCSGLGCRSGFSGGRVGTYGLLVDLRDILYCGGPRWALGVHKPETTNP